MEGLVLLGWMWACQPVEDTEPRPTPRDTSAPTSAHSSSTATGSEGTAHTGSPVPPLPPPPVNVLLIVADDFGVDHLNAYGETDADVRTPNLDSLAAEGRLYRNAWGYSACSPARAALFTGRHGRRTGYGQNWSEGEPFMLDLGEETLAELVARAPAGPWQSSMVGKWHLASSNHPDHDRGPSLQGWGYFQGTLGANLGRLGAPGDYFRWPSYALDGSAEWRSGYVTTDTTDEAIGRMRTMAEPWLLHVAYNAIHSPRHVPPDDLVTYPPREDPDSRWMGVAMAEAMDAELGRLLAAFSPEVRSRTLILFVADNGSSEPSLLRPNPNERGGLSKGSMRDFGVRIPFLAAGPMVGQPGVPSDALVSLVDVLPTVADLAGVDPATLAVRDGLSLLPTLADPTAPLHDHLYTELYGPPGGQSVETDTFALRDATYKLTRDLIAGTETFHEYRSGSLAEGRNLLPDLTPQQEVAYQRLSELAIEYRARMEAGQPPP